MVPFCNNLHQKAEKPNNLNLWKELYHILKYYVLYLFILMWEVVARYVNIGGIVDNQYFNVLLPGK
jgi:hypothetical protein